LLLDLVRAISGKEKQTKTHVSVGF